MLTLILDSATPTLYIAIVCDDKILYERYKSGKNEHSKYIVSLIEEGLKQNNLQVSSLDKIVVGIGPGSYTGVRMAVSVAKMFGSFLRIPVYSISTLYLMGSSKNEIYDVIIDARRNNVFGATINYSNNCYIVSEGLYPRSNFTNINVVNELEFKVDPFKCINNSSLVSNIDTLVPNYLRDTEAERNLKND